MTLPEYPGDGEHTHAQRVPFLVWSLLACVVILATVLIGLLSYLVYRQQVADQRAERTRQSLCAVIDRIPANVDPGVDEARRLDSCGAPHPPVVFFGRPAPTPTVTVTPSPRPAPPVARRGVTPAPTVTRTVRPSTRPTATPTASSTRRPTPSPSPSRTCTVHVGRVCI